MKKIAVEVDKTIGLAMQNDLGTMLRCLASASLACAHR
jgi:hypothetical protein